MSVVSATFDVNGSSSCCGVGSRKIAISYKYAVGSILFLVFKAKKGVMESVAIKKVNLVCNKYGQITILYVDTFNQLWNEEMLCIEEDARDFVIAYLERQQASILADLSTCSNTQLSVNKGVCSLPLFH